MKTLNWMDAANTKPDSDQTVLCWGVRATSAATGTTSFLRGTDAKAAVRLTASPTGQTLKGLTKPSRTACTSSKPPLSTLSAASG